MRAAGRAIVGPVLAVTLAAAGGAGCRSASAPDDPVDVVYAGSLTAILESELFPAFEAATGRRARGEPHGSVAGAHQIRDGVRSPDLYITADPGTLPLLGARDPGWAVSFAAGELAIGWTAASRRAASLDSAAAGRLAWHEVLSRPGFRLGRTDAAFDPKGYRTLWMFRLAEERYGIPGLAARLLSAAPVEETVFPEPHLPARAETGAVDAGVFYLAEARAHGLRALRLPPEVSLGSPDHAAAYAELRFTTSGGVSLRGAPIAYAATVPAGAPDATAGEALLLFLLGPRGRETLSRAGLPPHARALGDATRMPDAVRRALAAAGP